MGGMGGSFGTNEGEVKFM